MNVIYLLFQVWTKHMQVLMNQPQHFWLKMQVWIQVVQPQSWFWNFSLRYGVVQLEHYLLFLDLEWQECIGMFWLTLTIVSWLCFCILLLRHHYFWPWCGSNPWAETIWLQEFTKEWVLQCKFFMPFLRSLGNFRTEFMYLSRRLGS